MTEKSWDMYQYILESKPAVRNIVEHQDEIFEEALNYCAEGEIEQIYVVGSGTSYHGALACKKLLEDVLKVKVFASYPMQFKDNEQDRDVGMLADWFSGLAGYHNRL